MARLFAAHFTEKLTSELVSGEYDSEQELWVGDNQLQGATQTNSSTTTATTRATFTGGGGDLDKTSDRDPDVDHDSDNP